MPSYWSPKDERQYKHIVKSCHARDKRRSVSTCKRIAAATVNKHRDLDGLSLGAPKFHVEFRSSRTDRWHSMCETYADKRDAKQWARESKAHAVEVGNPPGRYRVVEGPSWECLGRRASVPVVAALLGALGITYYLSQKA
jgi:hypothetical protein